MLALEDAFGWMVRAECLAEDGCRISVLPD